MEFFLKQAGKEQRLVQSKGKAGDMFMQVMGGVAPQLCCSNNWYI